MSIRAMARYLNRSPSTISREVNRNRGRRWYKAIDSNRRAWRMSKRPKPCVLAINSELRALVIKKLKFNWSPEQISGWLKVNIPQRKRMHISHETIYKTLYVRSRNVLDTALMKHLRRAHKMRQSQGHLRSGDRGTINIVNGASIHRRSKDIESRKSIEHWEGDLVTGSNNTHITTLVDRKTRFTLILKLAGKDATSVNNALVDVFNQLPQSMKKTLT
jgi:IS30 family transposase